MSPPARSTATPASPTPRRVHWLAAGLVAAAVLVIGTGAVATGAVVRENAADIPTVTGITATTGADSIEFSWPDPGLLPSDSYQITATEQRAIIQTRPEFTIAAARGERVCVTVAVNRDGKSGPPSAEKCVDFAS